MAIGTNDFIEKFGTQDSLDSTSGSVANTVFSVAGDLDVFTNVDDAPFAAIVFEGDFALAPDANSVVELYAQMLNIISTSDEEVPDANNLSGLLGTFGLNDVATAQFKQIVVKLPMVRRAPNTSSSSETALVSHSMLAGTSMSHPSL